MTRIENRGWIKEKWTAYKMLIIEDKDNFLCLFK